VKDIYSSRKRDCVDCPEGIAAVVFDNLKHSRAFPPPGFGARMLAAKLRHAKRGSNFVFDSFREFQQLRLLEPTQNSGFSPGILVGRVMELS
jgi:hypothetical protein